MTIYHMDCLDSMVYLIAGYLADPLPLFLTDPPYGINLQNHDPDVVESRPNGWGIKGDHSQEVGQHVLDVLDDMPTMVFASPKKPWMGNWGQHLVWWKGPAVGGGGEPSMYWKMDWELIQTRNLGKLHGNRDSSVLRYWVTPACSPDHPAQKPTRLLRYLIGKISPPSVIDPFMGSGSTLVAAKSMGIPAIGIEIEEKYCEIAAKRLSQEVLSFG